MADDSLVRCAVGPLGSGKSMCMIMEMLRRAREQAPGRDGVRHTRAVCVRNTLQQLKSSVLVDIQQYLQPLCSYFVSDQTVRIRAPLDDGTTIHSDWMLTPLDDPQDVKRLLSTQLTFAWINEIREVPVGVVSGLIGRLGRFPSKMNGGATWFGLIADTNPWSEDSPYHERFVLAPDPQWKLFHQPSGIGPEAENRDNLPFNYYENLLNERDENWVDVHVRSQWGASDEGQAVFRRSFAPSRHVKDLVPVVNPLRPVIVGMDFGRTPCALISQVDTFGRLIVFREVTSDGMGLRQFINEHLKPVLLAEPYVGKRIHVVADPAGRERSQLAEENAFDVLKMAGLNAFPASTNDVQRRLLAVEKLLVALPGGEPACQISRTGCPTLVRALASMYRYRRKRDGELEDRPEKLHPWSDVADALQYLALAVNQDLPGRIIQRERFAANARMARPRFTARAWT